MPPRLLLNARRLSRRKWSFRDSTISDNAVKHRRRECRRCHAFSTRGCFDAVTLQTQRTQTRSQRNARCVFHEEVGRTDGRMDGWVGRSVGCLPAREISIMTITKLRRATAGDRSREERRASVLHVYVLSLFPEQKTTLRLFPFRSFLTLKKQRFEKINALVFCSSTSRKS